MKKLNLFLNPFPQSFPEYRKMLQMFYFLEKNVIRSIQFGKWLPITSIIQLNFIFIFMVNVINDSIIRVFMSDNKF
jgi:hypothetical protein